MAKNWIREDIKQVKKAAEKGNVLAKIEMAKRCFAGRNTERDLRQGYEWISSAADSDNAEALCILGYCYTTGTGVTASGRSGFNCFVKAAMLENAAAIYNLGVCYEYGIGTDKDWYLAQKLYRKSADKGYLAAKHVLVAKLWNKDTDDLNSKRRNAVLSWYAAQAKRGDDLAKRNLTRVRRGKRAQANKDILF